MARTPSPARFPGSSHPTSIQENPAHNPHNPTAWLKRNARLDSSPDNNSLPCRQGSAVPGATSHPPSCQNSSSAQDGAQRVVNGSMEGPDDPRRQAIPAAPHTRTVRAAEAFGETAGRECLGQCSAKTMETAANVGTQTSSLGGKQFGKASRWQAASQPGVEASSTTIH